MLKKLVKLVFVGAFTLFLILFILNQYRLAFREFNTGDKPYYQKSLDLVYKALGQNHDLNSTEQKFNYQVCHEQDYFKIKHPDIVLEDIYCFHVINDAILRAYQKDCFSISHHRRQNFFKAKKKLTIFHGNPDGQFRKAFMSKSCIFQMDISLSVGDIHKKSVVQERLMEYQDKLVKNNASIQCLQDSQFYPVSYSLSKQNECQQIIQILLKKFYEKNEQLPEYILKSDDHLGMGLDHITAKLGMNLVKTYQNGTLCGQIQQTSIIQELTKKPALLKGHKLDFRIWLLVVQAEPLIVYIYDYSGLMTCLDPYFQNNLTQYNFNCNSGLAKDYWNTGKTDAFKPLTLEQIHQGWTFQDWGKFFIEYGLVKSDDWWEKKFLPLVEMKIAYFFRSTMREVHSDARLSGLYAFDASMDTEMNLKLFELNVTPNFHANTNGNIFVQSMLHTDAFNLLKLYLAQRYKKLMSYIKNVMIDKLKNQQPIDMQELKLVLKMEALPQKKIHQFFLIDQKEALKNCEPYDQDQ